MTFELGKVKQGPLWMIFQYLPNAGIGVQRVSRYFHALLGAKSGYWIMAARSYGILGEEARGDERIRVLRDDRKLVAFAQMKLAPGDPFPSYEKIVWEIGKKRLLYTRGFRGYLPRVENFVRMGLPFCLRVILDVIGEEFTAAAHYVGVFLSESITAGNVQACDELLSHKVTRAVFDADLFDDTLRWVVAKLEPSDARRGIRWVFSNPVMLHRMGKVVAKGILFRTALRVEEIGFAEQLQAHPVMGTAISGDDFAEAFYSAVYTRKWKVVQFLRPHVPRMTGAGFHKALESGVNLVIEPHLEAMLLTSPLPSEEVRKHTHGAYSQSVYYQRLMMVYRQSLLSERNRGKLSGLSEEVVWRCATFVPRAAFVLQSVCKRFWGIIHETSPVWIGLSRSMGILGKWEAPELDERRRVWHRLALEEPKWVKDLLDFAKIALEPGRPFPSVKEVLAEINAKKETIFKGVGKGYFPEVAQIAKMGFPNSLAMLVENIGAKAFAEVPEHTYRFLRVSVKIGNTRGVDDLLSYKVTRAVFDSVEFFHFLGTIVMEAARGNERGMEILLSHPAIVEKMLQDGIQNQALVQAAISKALGIVKQLIHHPTLKKSFSREAYSEAFTKAVYLQAWDVAEYLSSSFEYVTLEHLKDILHYGIEKGNPEIVKKMILSAMKFDPLVYQHLVIFSKMGRDRDRYPGLVKRFGK